MPTYHEKHPFCILPQHDARIKYTPEDKARMIELHAQGLSQRAIAREIPCSRRTVQFTVFPEKLAHHKELYAQNRKDGRYYDRETHRKAIKKTRDKKKGMHE